MLLQLQKIEGKEASKLNITSVVREPFPYPLVLANVTRLP
jgi:hypothetical protein